MITNDGNIRSGTHLHWQLMGNLAVDKSNIGAKDPKWGILQNRREYFLNQLGMTTENAHYAGSGIAEITPEMAQKLANKGYTVVGSWKNPNPDKPGHIATVEPGHKEYNAANGPYFGNVGKDTTTGINKTAIDAFGPSRLNAIKYYYCSKQFSKRRGV